MTLCLADRVRICRLFGKRRQLVDHGVKETQIAAIRSRRWTLRKIELCREVPQNATWIYSVDRRVPVGEWPSERCVKLEVPSSAAVVSLALQPKLFR